MNISDLYFNTKKQLPDNIETRSGQLLLKGGFVSKSSRGVYYLNPLGCAFIDRIVEGIEIILRKNGFQKTATPILNLKHQHSGINKFITTDRDGKSFFLTDEPYYEFLEMIKTNIISYRQLPVRLYESRPKLKNIFKPNRELFNSYETKEVTIMMADVDKLVLQKRIDYLLDSLKIIFDSWGLDTDRIIKPNGAGFYIGTRTDWNNLGSFHNEQDGQYHSISHIENIGSESVLSEVEILDKNLVETPDIKTISELSEFLKLESSKLLKAILLDCNGEKTAVFLRGDRNLSTEKLAHNLGILPDRITPLADEDVIASGGIPGFIGPMGLRDIKTIIDVEAVNEINMVTGSNKEGYHMINVNYSVDFQCDYVMDVSLCYMDRMIDDNEIEIFEHTMILDLFNFDNSHPGKHKPVYKTDKSSNAGITTAYAKIDLYELMAIIVEKNSNDEKFILPASVSPCKFYVVLADMKDQIREKSEKLTQYTSDCEIYVDDRKMGVGFKIREAEAIGAPFIIIIGKKSEDDSYEWIDRMNNVKMMVNFDKLVSLIVNKSK